MSTTNWFLYVVKEAFVTEDEIIQPGENGVGRCSMEAPYGMMYVIPDAFVVEYHKERGFKRASSSLISEAVESYFGVKLK